MRVVLVNDLAPDAREGGGAEIYVARLASGLAATGDEVELFMPTAPRRPALRFLDVWDPMARRRLRQLVDRFAPDVVHHHNVTRELSVSVLGVPRSAACVLTVHDYRLLGRDDRGAETPLRRSKRVKSAFDLGVARRRVDIAVGASPAVSEALAGAGFRRVADVPIFGWPPSPGSAQPAPVASTQQVAYVGRLSQDKGVLALAEAFQRLADRHPRSRLVLVGEGPDRPRLESMAMVLGEGRMRLTGRLDEAGVRDVMASSRIVVRPSLLPEGAPTTAVEAALLGRPAVVSDLPGNRQLVDRSGGGLIVPPGDVDALCDALERLLGDDALATELGEAARREAMANHTVAVATERYRGLYREAIARRSAG